MKKLLLSMALLWAFNGNLWAQRTCGTMEYYQQQLANDPGLAQQRALIETQTQQFEQLGGNKTNAVYTIPVVVHVVYYNSTQNISDAQILSQITVLNQDFRRTNADASNTPSGFLGVAADCEVNFCLATVDPSGAATTGITRTSTTVNGFSDNDAVKFNAQGGKDIWDRTKYLNIWVCNLSGTLLGYAQFPGGPSSTDGVVIDYQYFGTTGTATAPFNKGRTATHEVGHWLNLYHIWGDDDGLCTGSDAVSDTPNQADANYGCPTFPLLDACTASGNGVMFMNYMDYTDDACMNLYTQGQKTRMQSQLAAGGSRASLATSNGCGVPGYCSSAGTSTADEWIQSVAFGSFTNNSGNNNGYGNYTATTVTFVKGVATAFTLTPGFSGSAYPEYWKVWIDLNGDLDFADVGELVYDAGATSTTARTGNITVPTSATATTSRMRVSMKYNGAQTACETFSYGEVEDYRVSLTTGGTCATPTSPNTTSISSSGATLNWTASGATSYNVRYKVNGGPTWTNTTSTTTSKVITGLSASTTYEWQVQKVCTGGTTSAFTTSVTFTTTSSCTDAYETNETFATAKTISVNTNISAKICTTSDVDWFKFTTSSGSPKVKVTLTGLPADYDLVLYNSSQVQLGSSTNGGTTSEQIIYNATAAATYYVKVYGYNGANSTTAYTLRASTQSANWREGSPEPADPKEVIQVNNDFLEVYPNPASDNLFINYFSDEGGSARLIIIDALGKEIIRRDVQLIAGLNPSILELTGLTNGLYFVRIETSAGERSEKFQVAR